MVEFQPPSEVQVKVGIAAAMEYHETLDLNPKSSINDGLGATVAWPEAVAGGDGFIRWRLRVGVVESSGGGLVVLQRRRSGGTILDLESFQKKKN
jgi:hypothetical protein